MGGFFFSNEGWEKLKHVEVLGEGTQRGDGIDIIERG